MNAPVAAPVAGVHVGPDGPVVDAETMAAAFGLSPDALRHELQAGTVTSLVERGEGSDAGRWRLTLRWRGKVWSVRVEPDGSAYATDPPGQVDAGVPALFRMVAAARTGPAGGRPG